MVMGGFKKIVWTSARVKKEKAGAGGTHVVHVDVVSVSDGH